MMPSQDLCKSLMGYMVPPFEVLARLGFIPQTILDIGAAHGHFYILSKMLWPDAKVTCVEGNRECQAFLRDAGEVYYEVLGAEEHVRPFYKTALDEVSGGNSYYREKTTAFDDKNVVSQMRQVRTLDSLLPGRQFDLLKIDTQGSELDIMKGGYSILGGVTVLVLEVALVEYNWGSPLIDMVIRFAQDHSFLIFDIVGPINGGHFWMGRKNQVDMVFISRSKAEWLMNP